MNQQSSARASHANLDRESRIGKARKIAEILGLESLSAARVLEIGTGSGVISAELARLVGAQGSVESVDIVDERVEREGYRFTEVHDVSLPFPAESFDVVISNHVIEHVGAKADQAEHVGEIARVLRRGGTFYLASPSRTSLIEPHFHLPLLSWLPTGAADAYVRLARRGSGYDCRLVTRHGLSRLLVAAGLTGRDVSGDAVGLFAREANARPLARLASHAPSAVLDLLRPLIPTMVVVGRHSSSE